MNTSGEKRDLPVAGWIAMFLGFGMLLASVESYMRQTFGTVAGVFLSLVVGTLGALAFGFVIVPWILDRGWVMSQADEEE